MNSFKSWRVSVASPKAKATIENYLSNNSGAVSIGTAVEFIIPFLHPWDDVRLTTDEGIDVYIDSEVD